MQMNALQVSQPRRFERVQIPIPRLPEASGYILVRNSWALTCGSDIPFFIGNKRHRSFPLSPGAPIHECIGDVVASSAEHLQPGDSVLSIPEADLGLAEYFIASASKTIPLSAGIGDLSAACIIQPLSTVINAVDRLGNLKGKSVAVIGLGAIGLMFVWLAKKCGADRVLGVDPVAYRCQFAEELGATATICSRGIEAVQDARTSPAKWLPPDICIEAVGHQKETIKDCLELVKKQGMVVAFGVPDQPVYDFEYEIFFRKNAVLMATVTPDWTKYLPIAHDLFLANKAELSRLVTHRMPIREAEKAYHMYERHENGIIKAALDVRGW
jgi:threonine dehydrogenase-like Zn-dependent dehydrogenase